MNRFRRTYSFILIFLALGWLLQYALPVSTFMMHEHLSHEVGAYCNCDDECDCSCALPLHHHDGASKDNKTRICGCDHDSPEAMQFSTPELKKAWLSRLQLFNPPSQLVMMLLLSEKPLHVYSDPPLRPPRA